MTRTRSILATALILCELVWGCSQDSHTPMEEDVWTIEFISFHLGGQEDVEFEASVRKNYAPAPDGTVVAFVVNGDATPPEGITGSAPTVNGVATIIFTIPGDACGISTITASTHDVEQTATIYCEDQP